MTTQTSYDEPLSTFSPPCAKVEETSSPFSSLVTLGTFHGREVRPIQEEHPFIHTFKALAWGYGAYQSALFTASAAKYTALTSLASLTPLAPVALPCTVAAGTLTLWCTALTQACIQNSSSHLNVLHKSLHS